MNIPRRLTSLVLAAALVLSAAACGGDDADGDDSSTGTVTTTTGATDPDETTTSSEPDGTTTTEEEGSGTTAPTFAGDEEPKSAEPDGTGTAQLVDVRVGEQPGATRFVLEFDGEVQPGYQVSWVDGPITEDGSGNPVDIEGDAFLQVLVQPATGYDLEAGAPTYEGPTRLAGPAGGAVTEAVRTGDFEALLTWVLGAEGRAPFTVSAFTGPSRLVIDIQSD